MALKMTNREVDGVSVVALDGRIVLGEESNALREKVKGLIAGGKKKIVLNMNNVTFIDSAGLGTLVASHPQRQDAGSLAQAVPSGQQVSGSSANYEAAYGFRRVQHGSGSGGQLSPKAPARSRREVDRN